MGLKNLDKSKILVYILYILKFIGGTMITKVRKWGNSLGVRIPKIYAHETHIKDGIAIDIQIENDNLIIKPIKKKYELKKLLSQIKKANIHNEINTGSPIGKEIW